jgi:hypothetical protein
MNNKISNNISKSAHSIVLVIASLLFIAALFYGAFFANAGTVHNMSGWAWSSNIGWVSFNCTDTSTCDTADYGVNVAINGDLSGFAWSDNIGWISFNEADLTNCPSGSCKAKLSGSNLQGWARALSNGDDWDGWISLKGSTYGVTKDGNNLKDYVWDASDINGQAIGIGWIQFDPPFGGVVIAPANAPVVTLSANPTSVSSGEDSTLTWSSSNATSCTGSVGWSGSKALSGSEVVGPHTIDTIYRLTCINAITQADDDATVFVSSDDGGDGGDGGSECSDGIDNDGDGHTDYPNDASCSDADGGDESVNNAQCSDGIDNDGDGDFDYPDDTGCSSADDDREQDFSFIEF